MADPLLAFVVTASVICGIILVSLYYLRRKRTSSTTTSALPVHTHGLPDTIQAPGANSADGVSMSLHSIRVVVLDQAGQDSVPHVSLETQEWETRLLRRGMQGDCNEDDALALGSAEDAHHI
jgi:hypothetical protein